jgi:hypothetical protein
MALNYFLSFPAVATAGREGKGNPVPVQAFLDPLPGAFRTAGDDKLSDQFAGA